MEFSNHQQSSKKNHYDSVKLLCSSCKIEEFTHLCLYCRIQRIICDRCYENKHISHQVITINDFMVNNCDFNFDQNPLYSRLLINNSHTKREYLFNYIENIWQNYKNKWNQLETQFKSYQQQFIQHFQTQFMSILYTFNQQFLQTTLQEFKNSNDRTLLIDKLIRSLKLATQRDWSSIDDMIKAISLTTSKVEQYNSVCIYQTNKSLSNMLTYLKKLKISQIYDNLIEEKKILVKVEELRKIQQEQKQNNKKQANQQSAIIIIDESKLQQSNYNNKIINIEESHTQLNNQQYNNTNNKIGQNQYNLDKILKLQNFPNNGFLQSYMDENNNILKYEQGYHENHYYDFHSQLVMNVWNYHHKLNLSSKQKYHIKHLRISYSDNKESVYDYIKQFQYLQTLVIEWCQLGSKQSIDDIIDIFDENGGNVLEHPLKNLHINCANQFDQQCLKNIYEKLPSLQTLYYGANLHHGLQFFDEETYFRETLKNHREKPFSAKILKELVTKMKYLKNMWIGIPTMYPIKQLLHQGICYLVIGQWDKKQANHLLKMTDEQWNFLVELFNNNQLISLAFINLQLNIQVLRQLINHNRFSLKTLYFRTSQTIQIDGCRKLQDEIFQQLRSLCPQLQQLAVLKCQQQGLTGSDIWSISTLKTLIIRQCLSFGDSKDQMQVIDNMQNLLHLNLYGNSWVDNQVIEYIHNLNIRHLNLGYTRVNSQLVYCFKNMTNLRSFYAGGTGINDRTMIQFSQALTSLHKLSLWALNGLQYHGKISNKKMITAGRRLKKLYYLDIGYCEQLSDQLFVSYHQLKYVNVWLTKVTENCKQQLRARNIIVFD